MPLSCTIKPHRESGLGEGMVDDALMESCRTRVVLRDDSRMSINTSSRLNLYGVSDVAAVSIKFVTSDG